MPALLEAKGLHAAYGETKVLHGIDFSVEDGGVTALLGANGAGKTTTLRAICGMVRTQGDIILGAVCGEIEKTQWGEFQGKEYRGYGAGTHYLASHGVLPDMCILGEPTDMQLVLEHAGSMWVRFGLTGKGRIEPGADADLVLVDLAGATEVSADSLLSRHRLSPYVGRTFRGRIVRTIVRGPSMKPLAALSLSRSSTAPSRNACKPSLN